MDDQRIGRTLRVLRQRITWRQDDVARAAKLSQDDVSRGERGQMRDISKLKRHAAALNAEVVVSVRWRGGELDRLMDEGHAALVGWVVELLVSLGWEVRTEVSYSIYGERGSIDVLAWHESTRTLVVVEVKTELTSLEETLRKHDAKQRLAPQVAGDRLGWHRPAAVCRMLVLPDTSTARRRVARHAGVLDHTYRMRGAVARSWMRAPSGRDSLLLFAPLTHGARPKRGSVSPKRVRKGQSSAEPN